MDPDKAQGAQLIGSVALSNAEEVFRTAGSMLGERLRRVPDGETGDRNRWIGWQLGPLRANPLIEFVAPDREYNSSPDYPKYPRAQLRAGAAQSDLHFDRLGYAAAALDSYALFRRLRNEGILPGGWRFQVSLPPPYAVVLALCSIGGQDQVMEPFTAAFRKEVDTIAGSIPHEDLAIQWDVCIELGIIEGVFHYFHGTREELFERLLSLQHWVPEDVEMGFHLCYGDYDHKHFKQPKDAGLLADAANVLARGITRPVNWIHMPVPIDRTDEAYFAPLRALKLAPATELYLGLVHYPDGVEGALRRIRAARSAVDVFGVSTECGMGRTPAAEMPELFRIHAEISEPIA